MHLTFFSSEGWRSWGLDAKPLIPEGMPVLIDDDLRFEDAGHPRATVVINRWLRELPSLGVPAPNSWDSYARVLRDWSCFLTEHGCGVFADRQRLKSILGVYAVHRASGPLKTRLAASTWNQHVSILSRFYRWAVGEGYATAEPFTYRQAQVLFDDAVRQRPVNLARRRQAKPHVSIKYLEQDFTELFLKGLAGLAPDGSEDRYYRGRTLTRNAAVGRMVVETGLRRQEFTYYLACEVPPLPHRPVAMPLSFPVPEGITKGGKFRNTVISYDGLAQLHRYLSMVRPLAAAGARWRPDPRWGEPLHVEEFDRRGGRVNGVRVRWDALGPLERRRLVAPDGSSMLLALKVGGGPFTAWPTVFERTAAHIREYHEPRFPHVAAHRLRHTFALAQLGRLVGGFYAEVARLALATDTDAALALYLSRSDPLMVLRDWLGHSSVLTTEIYLNRLDMTRIYREAWTRSREAGGHQTAQREADGEFEDDVCDFEEL